MAIWGGGDLASRGGRVPAIWGRKWNPGPVLLLHLSEQTFSLTPQRVGPVLLISALDWSQLEEMEPPRSLVWALELKRLRGPPPPRGRRLWRSSSSL